MYFICKSKELKSPNLSRVIFIRSKCYWTDLLINFASIIRFCSLNFVIAKTTVTFVVVLHIIMQYMDYALILSLLVSHIQYSMHIIMHASFNISNKSVNMGRQVYIDFVLIVSHLQSTNLTWLQLLVSHWRTIMTRNRLPLKDFIFIGDALSLANNIQHQSEHWTFVAS